MDAISFLDLSPSASFPRCGPNLSAIATTRDRGRAAVSIFRRRNQKRTHPLPKHTTVGDFSLPIPVRAINLAKSRGESTPKSKKCRFFRMILIHKRGFMPENRMILRDADRAVRLSLRRNGGIHELI
jgi:hypothetical protein